MSATVVGFRRVVVAIDASRRALTNVEVSARLAASLQAELIGLFVEDLDVLRLAALPFRRLIGVSQPAREVDPSTVERSLRAAAAEARASVERCAKQGTIRWSFRSVRGRLAAEALTAVESEDLLIVDRLAVDAATIRLLAAAPISVLFQGVEADPPQAILALSTGSSTGREAIEAAARIAAAVGRPLSVLLADVGESADPMREEIAQWLAETDVTPRYRRIGRAPNALPILLPAEPGAFLVLARAQLGGDGGELDPLSILRALRGSLLLVP